MAEPQTVSHCRHSFCKECLDEQLVYENACPTCKFQIRNNERMPNRKLANVIDHIKRLRCVLDSPEEEQLNKRRVSFCPTATKMKQMKLT
jgi:hypothetical protein